MPKPKITEVKAELQAAIAKQEQTITALQDTQNPQAKTLLQVAVSQQEAFQSVLDRLNGNRISIKMYT